MAIAYGSIATSSSGTSKLRVCCDYTESTAATGVKTVTYYYYLEVTAGDFIGTPGYVSWNPNASFTLNGVGTYQKSSTYTLEIPAGADAKSIPSATGGYKNTSSRRSTLDAISIASAPVPSFTNTISHWLYPLLHGEGNNTNKDSFQLASNTSFNQTYNTTFTLDNGKATTIPNGCYLASIDSSSVTGTWTHYTVGTKFTQPAKAMSFQYTYSPYTYTIGYDLDGGTNHSSNPSTYNVLYGVSLQAPTKSSNTFLGWEVQTEAKTMNFYAGSSENYKFNRILSNIQPGVQYTISLTGKLNSGTATGFRILTYDFTSSKVLTESVTIPFGSNIIKTYTCPSTADASHDIAIIIYAGVNGSTAGNNVTYSNVVVTYNTTGINEGDNATFSSASDLYSKLGTRMTGNVTAKAIWKSNLPQKIYIYNDGRIYARDFIISDEFYIDSNGDIYAPSFITSSQSEISQDGLKAVQFIKGMP